MLESRPFQAADLIGFVPQEWQRRPDYEITPEYCNFLHEYSHTALSIVRDGVVVAAGGAIQIWEGRAEIWMLLSGDCGRSFVGINRIANAFLDSLPFRRLETTCEIGWPQASRWLLMLGFSHESTARSYMPDGRDMEIYARIK